MEYTHSKDFLIELANDIQTSGWLKDLIVKVINNNGIVSDEDILAISIQLKNNEAGVLPIPSYSAPSVQGDIKFISLTHHNGVCALSKDQKISFSDDITLLYGNNGSGKSSYFRIMNEIIGGNNRTEILPNIYSSERPMIDIELEYSEGGNTKSIKWNGHERSIKPLNLSSVFDTSYTKSFLQKRNAEDSIILPYGLHLFASLSENINKIKGLINSDITQLLNGMPNIDITLLSPENAQIISQKKIRKNQRIAIEKQYIFSAEHQELISRFQNELKELQETNFFDKIKLSKNELSLLSNFENHLNTVKDKINNALTQACKLITNIIEAKRNNEETKNKIAILTEIGNTNSEEWRSFISSGKEYSDKSNIEKNLCPYCRQPILDKAEKIITAYSTYLSDKTINILSDLEKIKEKLKEEINRLEIRYQLSDDLVAILNTECKDITKKYIEDLLQIFDHEKNLLLLAIKNLNSDNISSFEVPSTFDIISASIKSACEKLNVSITDFTKKENDKVEKIKEIQIAIKPLAENRSIQTQKEAFVIWFERLDKIEELKKCLTELSTRNISTLAKNASNTLITENLKSKFQEELDALGLNRLRVSLYENASHGKTFMQIKLSCDNSVTDILSEGEQKGVALALFIAERKMQLSNNPIILDDPVNSLDHFIIAKLIERLSELDNQLIIFSHNLLLQTSLVSLNNVHVCGVNQISSCKKFNKHLYMYSVMSHGINSKGVIHEMKQDNLKTNLNQIKKILQNKKDEPDCMRLGSKLRHTIELIIDEKIFAGQIPTKFHGKKNSIPWDELKKLNPDSALIENLKKLFSRLSGGNLHNGIEQSENPTSIEELKDIYNQLAKLYV